MNRFLVTLAVGGLLAIGATPAGALPGAPLCPDAANKEVGIVPFARHTESPPCDCISFVSCMNLENNKLATVTVQFFVEGAPPLAQAGSDATAVLEPGEHEQFVTNTQTDPSIVLPQVGTNAGLSSNQDLSARVCSSTKKLACHAGLSCSCATAPAVSPLTFVVKKQRGD
jgi:hypothetical protein